MRVVFRPHALQRKLLVDWEVRVGELVRLLVASVVMAIVLQILLHPVRVHPVVGLFHVVVVQSSLDLERLDVDLGLRHVVLLVVVLVLVEGRLVDLALGRALLVLCHEVVELVTFCLQLVVQNLETHDQLTLAVPFLLRVLFSLIVVFRCSFVVWGSVFGVGDFER